MFGLGFVGAVVVTLLADAKLDLAVVEVELLLFVLDPINTMVKNGVFFYGLDTNLLLLS